MKKLFILLLITASLVMLNANDDEENALVINYFGVSAHQMDFSKLNKRLKDYNMKKFDENVMSFSLKQKSFDEENVIIAEIEMSYEDSNKSKTDLQNSIKVSYTNTLNLMLGYGRVLYETESFKFYPAISGGFSNIELIVSEKDKIDFDDALVNSKREIYLEKNELNLDLSLQTDFLIKAPYLKKGMFIEKLGLDGFAIGLRAGYVFGFDSPIEGIFSSKWESHNIDIKNGPDVGMKGPYISFDIGVWSKECE